MSDHCAEEMVKNFLVIAVIGIIGYAIVISIMHSIWWLLMAIIVFGLIGGLCCCCHSDKSC